MTDQSQVFRIIELGSLKKEVHDLYRMPHVTCYRRLGDKIIKILLVSELL